MNYKVKNWEEFQHYRDRNPPWIKLHFSILSSADWVMLDDASRVLAIACMLIASRNKGEVPADPEYIKRVAYLSKRPNFKPLIDCGFLEVASGCKQMLADARPEERRDREETETEEREMSPARKAQATLIPEDFELSEEMREYALARVPDMDTRSTFEDFKNHHLNRGTKGRDWVRGWYTWVGNCQKGFAYARAKRREQRVSGGGRKVSAAEFFDRQQNGPGAVHGGVVGRTPEDAVRDDPQLREA